MMALLSSYSSQDIVGLNNKITDRIQGSSTLEEAAQNYMSVLYENLDESIVLSRFFMTIPFKELPEFNKEIVVNLAESSNITESIKEQTLILSLLGTRGVMPEWNDRFKSRGHMGIPLATKDFVDKIPMMSQLLRELKAKIDWLDYDTSVVQKTSGSMAGVFYVPDAQTAVDHLNRKIIPAQDFVQEYNVKSVFGIGGGYLGTPLFFSVIIFLREYIDKKIAERFLIQANKFKSNTLNLVDEGKIFNL